MDLQAIADEYVKDMLDNGAELSEAKTVQFHLNHFVNKVTAEMDISGFIFYLP